MQVYLFFGKNKSINLSSSFKIWFGVSKHFKIITIDSDNFFKQILRYFSQFFLFFRKLPWRDRHIYNIIPTRGLLNYVFDFASNVFKMANVVVRNLTVFTKSHAHRAPMPIETTDHITTINKITEEFFQRYWTWQSQLSFCGIGPIFRNDSFAISTLEI